jgi:D-alanyl-D-alanine carboxypeptidase/D-alanyl-D-alanine-endopeptidase (penicillin-binding protein 4)
MQKSWPNNWVGKIISIYLFATFAFNLQAQQNNLLGQNLLRGIGDEASVSALVVNIDLGDTLLMANPNALLVPASTLKLLTTGAALEMLGPDFKYRTQIYTVGSISQGVLNGQLLVVGGGDPTLGSSVFSAPSQSTAFEQIFLMLQKVGITHVNGYLLVDASYFPSLLPPPGRIWEDIGNYYGALPCGLNYRDNTFFAILSSPSMPNLPCKLLGTEPELPGMSFKCKVVSSSVNQDSAYIYGLEGTKQWTIEGAIPAGQSNFRIKGALPFPPSVFAKECVDYLLAKGILFSGQPKVNDPTVDVSSKASIGEIESVPLSQTINYINVYSNNLLADNLYLTLAKKSGNEVSWQNAKQELTHYWQNRIKSGAGLSFADGNGLSPKNKVSARQFVDVLTYMKKSQYFDIYISSLAIGGKTGTLKNLWTSPDTVGRVFAKSGTLNGVVAYSGYFLNSKNQWCAFSITVNNSIKKNSEIRRVIESTVADCIRLP